jgi:hypothetical protein
VAGCVGAKNGGGVEKEFTELLVAVASAAALAMSERNEAVEEESPCW